MTLFSRNSKERQENETVVREAAFRLRETLEVGESLSEEARTRVLSLRVTTPSRAEKALRPLFFPLFRIAAAASVPMALVAVLSTLVLLNRPGSESGQPRQMALKAHKVGGQVVFTIANGSKVHYVYRSTVPGRFDPASGVRVEDGRFEDQAVNGAGVTFYKID